jgi:glycosyltransferase involved in cell wall biosynthesis
MKVSIITVSRNNEDTIEDTIKSVVSQSYPDIEYIIIDGGSTDGTLEIINKYRDRIRYCVSEKDKNHYDAMNKGIRVATGQLIGILNTDDFYVDDSVISDVVVAVCQSGEDSCYGDLIYVDREQTDRVIRLWSSGAYRRERFEQGWMPPHPAFFVRKGVYDKYGLFRTDYLHSGDYELMLRFLYKFRISTVYVPRVLTKMRTGGGGRPTAKNVAKSIKENYCAWKVNGLKPNPITFLVKPLSKISQYLNAKSASLPECR